MTGPQLKLLRKGDAGAGLLRQDLSVITSDPAYVRRYHSAMQGLCKRHGGIGLAACQAGLTENFFFVAKNAGMPKLKEGGLVVNPNILEYRGDKFASPEGCLSLPGRVYTVERSRRVFVRWQNVLGHWFEQELKGMAAVVFQHESDHLRGITLEESSSVTQPKTDRF